MAIFLLLFYVVLSSMGLILFKMGTTANGFALNLFGLNLHLSWQMIVGVLCYGFSFLLWLYIVSKNNLTYIYDYKETIRGSDEKYFKMGINSLREENYEEI